MKYNPDKHHRKSIRLKNYDYSKNGYYFITICSKNRECLFGEIRRGTIFCALNQGGRIVDQCWKEIVIHYENVIIDEFIIMPNHINGIIIINNDRFQDILGVQNIEPLRRNQFQHIIPGSIGSIIRGFKIGVTKWFRNNTDIHQIWQKGFYEHIIRNDDELNNIRKYIQDNPHKWEEEKNNPENINFLTSHP